MPADIDPIRFDGQVAIVTGAGRGLGASYARLLAQRGATVVVHDAGVATDGSGFDPSVADGVVYEIAQLGGRAVASYENLESAVGCQNVVTTAIERFRKVDVLIHNAGLVVFAPIDEMDSGVWDQMMNLGVHSSFHLIRSVVPHMKRQRYGRIVLTTSGRAMSLDSAAPGLSAYSMGKMAQVGLMFSVAAEVQDFGIRVNAISPVAATRVLRRSAPELLPELVAPGVVFLASSRCDASGIVLQGVGGRFAAVRCHSSEGVDFGPIPVAPETIAERWLDVVADGRSQRMEHSEGGSAGS